MKIERSSKGGRWQARNVKCAPPDTSGTTKNCLHNVYNIHSGRKDTKKVSGKKFICQARAVTPKVVRRHELERVLEGPAKCLMWQDSFFTLYFVLFLRKFLANVTEKLRYRLE